MNQPTYQILFYLLVFFHHVFIILTILTPFYVTFNEPFWIWVPINIWITHLMFSPVLVCPATIWENRLRRRLNKPEIKTFFLHYYIYYNVLPVTGIMHTLQLHTLLQLALVQLSQQLRFGCSRGGA